jgi:muconolactone delta-isomerase
MHWVEQVRKVEEQKGRPIQKKGTFEEKWKRKGKRKHKRDTGW